MENSSDFEEHKNEEDSESEADDSDDDLNIPPKKEDSGRSMSQGAGADMLFFPPFNQMKGK
jgi:hypothetical protein